MPWRDGQAEATAAPLVAACAVRLVEALAHMRHVFGSDACPVIGDDVEHLAPAHRVGPHSHCTASGVVTRQLHVACIGQERRDRDDPALAQQVVH